MVDWSKKWDKNEKRNNRLNDKPVFPMKVMIITGIVLFCFMIGFGMVVMSTSHTPNSSNCERFSLEYNTPVECREYVDTERITVK